MTYAITSAVCLFLLAMIPIWSSHGEQPHYPFWVILLLALLVIIVPMLLRRGRRDGAAEH